MCFEGNLGVCLNKFFVCVKCAYAPRKHYVLAELPVDEILLLHCLWCCSSFFMSLWSTVAAAPPVTLCLCCSWWPRECLDGLLLLATWETNTSMTMRPAAWSTLQQWHFRGGIHWPKKNWLDFHQKFEICYWIYLGIFFLFVTIIYWKRLIF